MKRRYLGYVSSSSHLICHSKQLAVYHPNKQASNGPFPLDYAPQSNKEVEGRRLNAPVPQYEYSTQAP